MHALTLECEAGRKDEAVAELWEHGTEGILEDELPDGRVRLVAFFGLEIPGLAERYGGRWEQQPARDWVAVSRAQWQPVLAGARFFLVPEWSDDPTPPGRLRLEMQPGQACGTGWHPATQLALQAMERHVAPGGCVLDIGTGSGILARAACLLGAGRVFACDTDVQAVAVARARFLKARAPVGLFLGSVRSVRGGSVDTVVANIDAEALIALAPEIVRVRASGGRLVLTGFPRHHLERVRDAYSAGDVLEKEEWVALVC